MNMFETISKQIKKNNESTKIITKEIFSQVIKMLDRIKTPHYKDAC